ncbi:MAG TPA: MFS transporter [Candidatus Acidoferrales bacterium]|nr:MFS transporter [Candidatus Acidoferrales bacterium]
MNANTNSAAALPDPAGGISHAWRALRHRNFRLFFSGQSISLIGTWMTRLATSWLVYRLTGSAFLLGIVGFSGQIPTFLLAPFAGVWVDRLNRQHVLIVTQALAMLQSFALAFLTLTKHITVHEVILLSAFQGMINAFDMPGRQAFLVEMVEDRQDLGNAIALNSSMVNMARLVGPSLAGMVIAVSGEGSCFLIDGISYLAVIASLFAMRLKPAAVKRATTSMLVQLREGWDYVSGFAPIRTILTLFATVSLMGWPFTVLMPIFASKILKGGPHTLGFLMGAVGIGALISAISLAIRKSVIGLGRMIYISTALFGVSLIFFGLSRNIWLSLVMMLFCGFGMMQQMAASNTIIQTIVDEDKRGRVMSFYTVAFVGMAPFGSLLAGAMAHAVGAPRTVMLSGACCIAGAIWFFTRLKSIRKLIRPIYVNLGILPGPVNAVIQDSIGR